MEEFNLINKQRNRIKIFKPFEDISKSSQLFRQWQFYMHVFIKDRVNQLLKVQGLNL